jgi:hypothetical protein
MGPSGPQPQCKQRAREQRPPRCSADGSCGITAKEGFLVRTIVNEVLRCIGTIARGLTGEGLSARFVMTRVAVAADPDGAATVDNIIIGADLRSACAAPACTAAAAPAYTAPRAAGAARVTGGSGRAVGTVAIVAADAAIRHASTVAVNVAGVAAST